MMLCLPESSGVIACYCKRSLGGVPDAHVCVVSTGPLVRFATNIARSYVMSLLVWMSRACKGALLVRDSSSLRIVVGAA